MKLSFGIMLGLCILTVSIASGADPAWWRTQNTRIVDPALDPQPVSGNYVPVNLGQLKNVAKMAAIYLEDNLDGGAGPNIWNLVNTFEPVFNRSESEKAQWRLENYAIANIGQLKAVTKVFYQKLNQSGYRTKENLIRHGYPVSWGFDYPWNSANPVTVEQNYVPINLGQLKVVFSFDIINEAYADNDPGGSDSLPDDWELENLGGGLSQTATGDFDNDLVINSHDARPGDPTVGALSIVITQPVTGSVIP